ncbi:MAG: phenylalanine--tRNA ligase subunit beta [Deltaproteobacteria bacterium]|nr:phenylalanine--tRNA ligase subunit beta [Deltaproteobacteria bacterium]
MRIAIDWVKEFIPLRWNAEELSHHLTMAGLEVESVEGKGDQTVLTLGITPNRGDCLSILGVAREISALQGKPFPFKPVPAPKGEGAIKDILKVKVSDTSACPRYMARVIRGLKIAPSPQWLKDRLTRVGLRPINNVVDATNYVMWELGHPLHAFDRRFLKGGEIIVRKEKSPLRFATLDGAEALCEAGDLFICDGERPVALAGIMGGKNSEVSEATTEIVLEAACFNPQQIHRTAKRLKIKSESSYRFERGVDPNGVANALHRVTEIILQTAGGKASADWIDIYPKKIKPASLLLSLSEIERHLGIEIPKTKVKQILEWLGFKIGMKAKCLHVQVPTWRTDISKTIDLVEEVARIYGYDKIPALLPPLQMNLPERPKERSVERQAVQCLTSLGFSETCHLNFTSEKKGVLFAADPARMVFLSNPLSEEHLCLRPSLLPGLLDAMSFNLHRQQENVKLFELKKIFKVDDTGPCENKHLAVAVSGREWPSQWQIKPKLVDFFSLKGLLNRLALELHLSPLQFMVRDFPSFLVPTAAATIEYENKKMGWVGLLDPAILKIWEIETPLYALEIDWSLLSKAAESTTLSFKPLSKYPYIERDLALIVDARLPVQKVMESIKGSNIPWIQNVSLFDVFKGGSLPADKKSLAFTIRYASHERTLTNEEVNTTHVGLISRLEMELPAQLRK